MEAEAGVDVVAEVEDLEEEDLAEEGLVEEDLAHAEEEWDMADMVTMLFMLVIKTIIPIFALIVIMA